MPIARITSATAMRSACLVLANRVPLLQPRSDSPTVRCKKNPPDWASTRASRDGTGGPIACCQRSQCCYRGTRSTRAKAPGARRRARAGAGRNQSKVAELSAPISDETEQRPSAVFDSHERQEGNNRIDLRRLHQRPPSRMRRRHGNIGWLTSATLSRNDVRLTLTSGMSATQAHAGPLWEHRSGGSCGNQSAPTRVARIVSQTRSEPFVFISDGDRLAGVLYLPARQPVAAVVTTGPLTSVKEQATGAYARALAARGFAALAFDHRTFGRERRRAAPVRRPRGQGRRRQCRGDCARGRRADPRSACRRRWHLCRRRVHGQGRRRRRTHPRFAGVAGYYSERPPSPVLARGVPGGDRPWAGGGEALARDGRRRDHPGGRAGRR